MSNKNCITISKLIRLEKFTSAVDQLKQEVSFLKDCLRNYEVEDESIQPLKNDKITRRW